MATEKAETNLQSPEFNIFMALDWIRDNAKGYAQAKANRIYMEEYRKTLKSLLMRKAECTGVKTLAAQERDAYSHDDYQTHLNGLKEAVEVEEEYRWLFVAAQAKIEAWRTIESTRRAEAKQFPS